MTISQIAAICDEKGSHYLDRKTLKFFGQTRSDFKVYHAGKRIFIGAPRRYGFTAAEFNPETAHFTSIPCKTFTELKRYVKSLLQ